MDVMYKVIIGFVCGSLIVIGCWLQLQAWGKSIKAVHMSEFIELIIFSCLFGLIMIVVTLLILPSFSSSRLILIPLCIPIISLFMWRKKYIRTDINKFIKNSWDTTISYPYVISSFVFLFIAFGSLSSSALDGIYDSENFQISLNNSFNIIQATGILCFAFFLKSVAGKVTIFTSLAWLIWTVLVHDDPVLISPVFELVLDAAGNKGLPAWASTTYIALTIIYNLTVLIFLLPDTFQGLFQNN